MRLLSTLTLIMVLLGSARADRVPNVTATTSIFDIAPIGNTVDGSGLSELSLTATHSATLASNSFAGFASLPDSVVFDLNGTYRVSGLSFWNQNDGGPGALGSTGVKDVTFEYSADGGSTWTALPGAPTQFAQETGPTSSAQTASFTPVVANAIRMTISSNWGDSFVGFAEIGFNYVAATVTPTSVTVAGEGGTTTVNVGQTNGGSWTAVSNSAWLSVNPTAGTGDGPVTIAFDSNPSGVGRVGHVTIADQDVTVIQSGVDGTYAVYPSEIQAANTGGTADVFVTLTPADAVPLAWFTSNQFPWVRLSQTEGSGSAKLSLSWDANTSALTRSATLIIAGRQVRVFQAGQTRLLSVSNAASQISGPVAAGEQVRVTGTFGPNTYVAAVADKNGMLPTSLGDLRVTFDGLAAPILYASTGQAAVIVPSSVITSTKVIVEDKGVQTNAMTVPVADANPGIFSCNDNPQLPMTGDGSCLVQVNRGAMIQLWITGAGTVTPAPLDGQVPKDAKSTPNASVNIRFNDVPAPACAASAAVLVGPGVVRVTTCVPADAPTGSRIPITVSAGSAVSKPLFVSVK